MGGQTEFWPLVGDFLPSNAVITVFGRLDELLHNIKTGYEGGRPHQIMALHISPPTSLPPLFLSPFPRHTSHGHIHPYTLLPRACPRHPSAHRASAQKAPRYPPHNHCSTSPPPHLPTPKKPSPFHVRLQAVRLIGCVNNSCTAISLQRTILEGDGHLQGLDELFVWLDVVAARTTLGPVRSIGGGAGQWEYLAIGRVSRLALWLVVLVGMACDTLARLQRRLPLCSIC